MPRLFFLLALAVCAAAQTRAGRSPAAPSASTRPSKWPIHSLAVEGNHVFPSTAVLAVAGLKIGELAGEPEFDAARDRLTATGAFETVGYKFTPSPDGKGFLATFQVAETTSLYPAKFEDLGAPESDITAALAARDPLFLPANLPGNQATIDRYAAYTQEFLAARGVRQEGAPVKVAGAVVDIGKGSLVILFRPQSAVPAVSRVTFEGNQIVPGSVLRTAIALPGVGAPYTERHFREILDAAIRPVYEARGRMRVTFPKIRTEPESDVKGVHVFVTVDEGEVYTLSKISIAQPSPLPDSQLLREADIKTGDVANFDLIAAGQDRIRAAVRRAGYLDAKVTMDRQFDDPQKSASVTFHIDPGAQYHMGKLIINGLDLDGEAEIKRIWTLKLGDAFNPEYPDHFLETVRREAIFDHLGKTKSEIKIDPKTSTVDVTLTFQAEDDPLKKLTRRRGY
ncbi:MAG TPA: POTRA domain-containing protein [Bryobacteraceae bacterium]|jgi:outer membrane protein assembly factor BamA|nr:POTRA domain-containing protein [Bryobacteraceae bacterium]